MYTLSMQKKRIGSQKLNWEEVPDIKKRISTILITLNLSYIRHEQLFCYRSFGSTSHSYARIWAFPKIFQHALHIAPSYVIEVLAKYFDRLDTNEQTKVLIHELLHIPKNFSGALLPHKKNGKHMHYEVRKLFTMYKEIKENNLL
jgi:predicted metallopeptidase